MEVMQEVQRRGRFRDVNLSKEKEMEDELIVENSINPFFMVMIVGVFVFSLALFVALSAADSSSHQNSSSFDLTTIQRSEPDTGLLWHEINPFFEDIVFESESFLINDWQSSYYGTLRGLVFKKSVGIEGVHSVSCGESPQECKSIWPSSVPPSEYVESMAMGLVTILLKGDCEVIFNEREVLHVGLGAGTLPLFLYSLAPAWKQTVIELSQEVIDVAPYFGIKDQENISLVQNDAEIYFRSSCGHSRFHAIAIDAFDEEDTMPKIIEEASEIKKCLHEEGMVIINLVMTDGDPTAILRIVGNYKKEFKQVIVIEPAQYHRILIAHNKEAISHEEFFFLTEKNHATCPVPRLSRGVGFWIDASDANEIDITQWLVEFQHRKRGCRGLQCLF